MTQEETVSTVKILISGILQRKSAPNVLMVLSIMKPPNNAKNAQSMLPSKKMESALDVPLTLIMIKKARSVSNAQLDKITTLRPIVAKLQ